MIPFWLTDGGVKLTVDSFGAAFPSAPISLSGLYMSFNFTDKFDVISSGNMTLKITQKYVGDNEMLPFYYYDIYVRDECARKISVRIGHNFHSYYNGNIGYEIFEEYRGHGAAYEACRTFLDVARFHGMGHILSCGLNNIASYKTVEKLGAELLEITDVPREYFAWREGMEKLRIYSLDL